MPAGTDLIAPCVALPVSAEVTSGGCAEGWADRYSAAAPATWGDAIEVPLMVFVAVFVLYQSDVMPTPGALMSTQLPKFEKDANPSLMSVAATVMAEDSLEGELLQALAVLFPAATAKVTPALTALATAWLSVAENPPPRLMFAAAGRTLFAATQSIPAITPDVVPDPEQFSTRTATRFTFFATP